MEYFIFALVGYILVTQAFLYGVKHGRRLDTHAPIRTVVDTLKPKVDKETEFQKELEEIMSYNFESALEDAKRERNKR